MNEPNPQAGASPSLAVPSAVSVAKATPAKKAEIVKAPSAEPKVSEVANTLWLQYRDKDIVNDFAKVPTYVKLALMQTIPHTYAKSRKIGGQDVYYLTHEFSEKALNFAFNFNVDTEVESANIDRITVGGKPVDEAVVRVKFTFTDDTGRKIVKTVFAGHRLYESAATTKADALKSALSKAYSVVARQFGIGSNVKFGKRTVKAEDIMESEPAPAPAKPAKSFEPSTGEPNY